MPLRHLVVTPLPNGRNGNIGFLSVHLSPRLRQDGVLSDYPDFGDWGQFVTAAPALQFQVLVNGVVRPAGAVTVVSPPVNRDVWRAVFGRPANTIPVKKYAFRDRRTSVLHSIDSATLTARALELAATIAALGAGQATRAQVEQASADLRALLPAASDFYGKIGDGADPPAPSTEFHDQLGLLGAHPYLLRVLGLVYDLEVTLPANATEVSVRTNWVTKAADPAVRDEIPMRVSVDQAFVAVVQQPEYRSGAWLRLGGAKYQVAQLDQINATAQLGHLDDELEAAATPGSVVEVPALLESGLSIIHRGLDEVLVGRFARQRLIEDGIDDYIRNRVARPPVLLAEDITTGYRYDVDDLSRPGFRSLNDRQAPNGYVFPRKPQLVVAPPADEGWESIALFTDGAERHVPASTTVRYPREGHPDVIKAEERDVTSWRVDDHVVTWAGWSLATPRVGNSTTGDGAVRQREPNALAPGSPTQVVVDYAHVNGTLPKLRYGHTYSFRARTVDLSGNGPALGAVAPAEGVSPQIRFGRLAPLSPPQIVRRESRLDPGVGDLPHVLVIRSELTDTNPQIAPTDRLLFPPRISQGRLERHDLPAGGNDPGSYNLIATRDARSLADQTIEDPETGELVAGTAIVDGAVTQGPTRPPVLYLPDPVTQQAAFHGLPNATSASPVLVSYGTWPTFEAVQLELRSGVAAPSVSSTDKRVTVTLPKGTIARAELSSAPDPKLVGHLLLAQSPSAAPGAGDGSNRALSPRRPITFVHAVRVPLSPPSFRAMTATRTAQGQTDVVIAGTALLHRATTEHLVLHSRWVDTVDDPAATTPVEQVNRRALEDLSVPVTGNATSQKIAAVSLELGDTKRRLVDLTSEAFCRFSRYFTERIDFITGTADTLTLDRNGVAPTTVVVSNLSSGAVFERGRQYTVDKTTGELTIVDAAAFPPGTTCRAEFVPLPVSRQSVEARSAGTFTFDVPSSAAPPVPGLIAALPAFARTVTSTATSTTIVHDGRVVRLHLDRPWFASGRGELLGVAVDLASAPTRQLTRWGRDPLTASSGPFNGPSVTDFPKATAITADVDGRFGVAGHDVTFDEARRLWMADVLVDATFGYRPFVFLHICRHQPLALAGLHVSGTVEVNPVRLGAWRQVTVTSTTLGSVEVTLSGPDDDNVVSVIVQEADSTIADPDLRWHDATGPVVLARTGTTAAATHRGVVALPASGAERRLVIEDAERTTVGAGGTRADATVVAYREVVAVPAGW
jgi:hypothetical protein